MCTGCGPGRAATATPTANPNFLWAYDFVFDAMAVGQQIKCLTVVDEFTRACLAIAIADSIRSRRVIEALSHLVSTHVAPLFMRSDNVLNASRASVKGEGTLRRCAVGGSA